MKKYLLPVLLLVSFIPLTAIAQQGQEFKPGKATYLWPTDASPYLTSTFAETRSSHFHAALDIKTWGRRGYKIFASRDGIVHRIAIGPKGYGKVIYLKHPDESFSVYAHLLEFNESLQQLADSIRFEEGHSFELNEFIEDRNIKVEQGEVIGYSGASGIGPPHLHFELRTPAHKPFNPLLTNLSVEDSIAPQIINLSVEPRSVRSSVEGNNSIFTKRARRQGDQYQFGKVKVSGPVGLGINVFDQSNNVHNIYAAYQLKMSVDGQELFKSQADSFSYLNTHQMFIDRIYPLLKKDGKAYQRLFIADGNSLSFYQTNEQKGLLDLPAGVHNVTIDATDYFGNTSTASLQLEVEPPENRHPGSSLGINSTYKGNTVNPHLWDWYSNWVTLEQEVFQQLTIANKDSSNLYIHDNGIGLNLKESDNLFLNIPKIGPVTLRRVKPETESIITTVEQDGFARLPTSSFYDTVSVGMSIQKLKDDSIEVNIFPDAYPVKRSYEIYTTKDSTLNTSKLSFYKKDQRNGDWDLIRTKFSDNFIIGEAESLGSFTTLRDTTPPLLEDPQQIQRTDGQWLIAISATDNLSGINYHKTKMSINGTRGIAEYEPEDDRFIYYHPRFTPSSDELSIEITAYDKMGNERKERFLLKNKHRVE